MTRLFAALVSVFLALPLRAEPVAPVDHLIEALALNDILKIMHEEGLDYGQELRDELFAGRGGDAWPQTVASIYDETRMQTIMRDGLAKGLSAQEMAPIIGFFTSDIGQRIVKLEVSARRAMLDEGVEEASLQALYALREDAGDDRLDLLYTFVTINDLLDSNVVGALNANYEFYLGLVDGGAFPFEITQEQILSDVWAQEPDIRSETEDWLYSYLLLAYDPLKEGDMDAYIAFSETPGGQALNRALFEAFDDLFRVVSRELGLGAAQLISGEDI